jgi:hypothetical protein
MESSTRPLAECSQFLRNRESESRSEQLTFIYIWVDTARSSIDSSQFNDPKKAEDLRLFLFQTIDAMILRYLLCHFLHCRGFGHGRS